MPKRKNLTSVARSVLSKTSQQRFTKTSKARMKQASTSANLLKKTTGNVRYITDPNKWRPGDTPVFSRKTGEQVGAYRGI